MDDLASLDPELYQGLIFLKHYSGNFDDLSLNFALASEGTECSVPRKACQHVDFVCAQNSA